MATTIILNPKAGTAAQQSTLLPKLEQHSDVTWHVTQRPRQATRLASEALAAGSELVVAAGGDGTVNEVVNGLATDFRRARLGIIPLGTGNDLARTLAIPAEPLEAFELLTTGTERAIDVIRVETAGIVTYGVNMAIGGFTGQMNETLTDDLKRTWGPLSYLLGAAQALPDLTNYATVLTWDDDTTECLNALNIAVANGRTAASHACTSPHARACGSTSTANCRPTRRLPLPSSPRSCASSSVLATRRRPEPNHTRTLPPHPALFLKGARGMASHPRCP